MPDFGAFDPRRAHVHSMTCGCKPWWLIPSNVEGHDGLFIADEGFQVVVAVGYNDMCGVFYDTRRPVTEIIAEVEKVLDGFRKHGQANLS